jgi:hypothetical protein
LLEATPEGVMIMNQIRIAALSDLKSRIPATHYLGRPYSIDADLEIARLLLRVPEGLTPLEYRAAQALQDWAFCEQRFRTISVTAYPARDCDDKTPAPGMTPDQEQELTARREVHRRSALAYARMLDDAQLIEHYQPAEPASDTEPAKDDATPAPVVVSEIDFTMVATRKELIDAFGKFTNMDMTWFDNLTDSPKLRAARKITGQGGRHSAEPLFCPYEVMQWLADPKRRKGKPLNNETAWRLLKGNFGKVYNQYSIGDPNSD